MCDSVLCYAIRIPDFIPTNSHWAQYLTILVYSAAHQLCPLCAYVCVCICVCLCACMCVTSVPVFVSVAALAAANIPVIIPSLYLCVCVWLSPAPSTELVPDCFIFARQISKHGLINESEPETMSPSDFSE